MAANFSDQPGRTHLWSARHEALAALYGVSLDHPEESHPLFGSSVKFELPDGMGADIHRIKSGEESFAYEMRTSLQSPTLHRLSELSGFVQWARDNVDYIARQSQGFRGVDVDDRFIEGAYYKGVYVFTEMIVKPLRHAFEEEFAYPFYFRCIPEVSLEEGWTAGRLLKPVGPRVLSLLPMTPEVALFFDTAEPEIRLLARQVMWWIQYLCNYRKVRRPEQLIRIVGRWRDYLTPVLLAVTQDHIQEINPYLMTSDSRRALSA